MQKAPPMRRRRRRRRQVFLALSWMRDAASALRNAAVIAELAGVAAAGGGEPDEGPWGRLMDAELRLGGERTTLKAVVETHIIAPLLWQRTGDPLREEGVGQAGAARYSMILYGPPGTAKTTICAALARRLGWAFVTVAPLSFALSLSLSLFLSNLSLSIAIYLALYLSYLSLSFIF